MKKTHEEPDRSLISFSVTCCSPREDGDSWTHRWCWVAHSINALTCVFCFVSSALWCVIVNAVVMSCSRSQKLNDGGYYFIL